MKEIARRYFRYAKYMLSYIFAERLWGLDFSMRDKSLIKATGGIMHGYSKTPYRHMKNLLNQLDFDEPKAFLDIGCGKGYVLKLASQYPFSKVAGIEYDKKTFAICKTNLKRLKLNTVEVSRMDARQFVHYGDYNVFFLFNPFGEEIFRTVLELISKAANKSGKCTIIYHNPICHQMIMDTGCFDLSQQLYDREKGYITNIYVSFDNGMEEIDE